MTMASIRSAFVLTLSLALGAILPASDSVAVDLEQIKKRGKVVVATQADYPPFEFIQDGRIVGYDKDLLDNIVAHWGVELEQIDLPFAGILTGLMQGRFDFVCTALIANPERVAKFAFTMPMAVSRVGIYRRKGDSKVTSVNDLTGVTMGAVVPPSGPTAVLAAHNADLQKVGKGAKDVRYFQGSTDLSLALANGQVDAWTTSRLTMDAQMKRFPDKFELVDFVGKPFYFGWVTRPEDTKLRDQINVEFKRLRDSGEMAKLQQKWFGHTMEIPDSGYLPEGAK
jgi:polar amino acid transport system substrate-binding protein